MKDRELVHPIYETLFRRNHSKNIASSMTLVSVLNSNLFWQRPRVFSRNLWYRHIFGRIKVINNKFVIKLVVTYSDSQPPANTLLPSDRNVTCPSHFRVLPAHTSLTQPQPVCVLSKYISILQFLKRPCSYCN